MNNIVPFTRSTGLRVPTHLHPAAISAAQLCAINDIDPEDFLTALNFFLDLYESDAEDDGF